MMRRLVVLVFALGLAACGKDEEKPAGSQADAIRPAAPTRDLDAGIAAMVPADAVALVYVESIDALLTVLREIAAVGGEPVPDDAVGQIGRQLGFDASKLDTSRPLAIAVSMAGMPAVTAVVPSTDPAALGASFKSGPARAGDAHVALPLFGMAKAGVAPATLVSGLPEGGVVARVDLDAVMRSVGPMAEMLLANQEEVAKQMVRATSGPGADEWVRGAFQWVRALMASAETLDLVAGLDGGTLGVQAAFTAKEKSAFAEPGAPGALGKVVGHVGAGYPVNVLFSFEARTWLARLRPLVQAGLGQAPPEIRGMLTRALADWDKWAGHLGDDYALGFALDENGFRVTGAMAAPDPDALIARVMALAGTGGPGGGFTTTVADPRKVDGTPVHGLRLRFDAQKYAAANPGAPADESMMLGALLGGPKGAVFEACALDGKVVLGWASQGTTIEDALTPGTPPALGALLDAARGDVGFLLHLDLRGLMRGAARAAAALGAKAPEFPAGDPVPLDLVASRDGRTYRLAFALDLAGAKEIASNVLRESSDETIIVQPHAVPDGR